MPLTREQAILEGIYQSAAETARQLSVFNEGMRRLVFSQLDYARTRAFEDLFNASTTQIDLIPKSNNTVEIHTVLVAVGTGVGTVTIQLADKVLGPLPNPATGVILLHDLRHPLQHTDIRRVTLQNPGACYFALYGVQQGDAGVIG